MPIRLVESQRLYRQIAEQLTELMAKGEFPPGARLPSERELAAQLGVSRPSVREALIALEVERKVEVRVGAGIFTVAARPVAVKSPATEGQGPFELLRARWLIEGEIAMEAARSAQPGELDVVREAVAEMGRHHRQRRSGDAPDRNFHLGIAKASHNSALVSVVCSLWDQGRGDIWKRMEHHFQTPELLAEVLNDHRAILQALEARDGRAARTAMRRHLEHVDREFTRGWELLKARETGPVAPLAASAVRPPTRRSSRSR